MKKALSVLLAALLLFTAAASAFAAANGDVDGSGAYTAADARKILRAAVKLETLSAEETLLADLDMDGTVTASDARTALRLAVKLDVSSGARCANEYEVLNTGVFMADLEITMGMSYRMKMAATEKTTYLEMSIRDLAGFIAQMTEAKNPEQTLEEVMQLLSDEEISQDQVFGMLITEKDFYLIDPAGKAYYSLGEMFGEEDASMGDAAGSLLGELPALSQADAVTQQNYRGKKCTAYTFQAAQEQTVLYMSGKKLCGMVICDEHGDAEMSIDFKQVSYAFSAEYAGVSAGYRNEATDALNDVFLALTVMMLAMS